MSPFLEVQRQFLEAEAAVDAGQKRLVSQEAAKKEEELLATEASPKAKGARLAAAEALAAAKKAAEETRQRLVAEAIAEQHSAAEEEAAEKARLHMAVSTGCPPDATGCHWVAGATFAMDAGYLSSGNNKTRNGNTM